jgi:hypothetical protein
MINPHIMSDAFNHFFFFTFFIDEKVNKKSRQKDASTHIPAHPRLPMPKLHCTKRFVKHSGYAQAGPFAGPAHLSSTIKFYQLVKVNLVGSYRGRACTNRAAHLGHARWQGG